jgi:hypothetical protein
MKKLALAILFLSIGIQPLYSEYLTDENTYANDLMAKKTYFAGASSLEKQENMVRKPASIEKKGFYQRYLHTPQEDRYGYTFE